MSNALAAWGMLLRLSASALGVTSFLKPSPTTLPANMTIGEERTSKLLAALCTLDRLLIALTDSGHLL